MSYESGVVISDISDHFFTFLKLGSKSKSRNTTAKTYRNMSDENMNKFKLCLSNLHWQEVLDLENPNDGFNCFWETFHTLFEINFPLLTRTCSKNNTKLQGFMTQGLMISRKKKLKLYKKSLVNPSTNKSNAYKSYRNLYNKVVRASKMLYYKTNVNKNKNNPKEMWKTLKEAINMKSAKSNVINQIVVDDITVTDSVKIANEFNSFFSQVGKDIKDNIPVTNASVDDYLNSSCPVDFEFGYCSPQKVADIISSLESKATLDIDGINTKLLKAVAQEISIPLSHIFECSFQSGNCPDRLKTHRTVPIHKSGSLEDLNNYRPIACLPVISKVLEKIAANSLKNHLLNNNLIYNKQFGFQAKNSTLHPLVHICDYIGKALNNNEYVVGVFLDLKKAFDLVDHSILLKKLQRMGIRKNALKWFESYLNNRKQYVMVNGKLSSFYILIDMSVPQGSILGPILFLIYINDLPNSNNLLQFLFADDTTGLEKGKNLPEVIRTVNFELQKLGIWLRANKLAINTSKTKVMIFHQKGKPVPDVKVYFNNNDIGSNDTSLIHELEIINNDSPCPNIRMLGVLFDENLTFKYHVDSLKSKISYSLFLLNSAKNTLSSNSLKLIYYALIHSHLVYCLPIFSIANKKTLDSLFTLQKRAIRIICKARYNDHTQPLFFKLKILPLDLLKYQQIYHFMHAYEHNYLPISFNNFFSRNSEMNKILNLRNDNDIHIPFVRLSFLDKFPFVAFANIWNELPTYYKSLPLEDFRPMVKEYLFEKIKDFSCDKLYCISCSN